MSSTTFQTCILGLLFSFIYDKNSPPCLPHFDPTIITSPIFTNSPVALGSDVAMAKANSNAFPLIVTILLALETFRTVFICM